MSIPLKNVRYEHFPDSFHFYVCQNVDEEHNPGSTAALHFPYNIFL